MRKVFFVIVLFFIGLLPGCRGQRQMETTETKQQTTETAVEFHDLQRFWNSLAERLNFKIEFYPAEGGLGLPTTDNCVPIDPTDSHIGTLPTSGGFGGSGGVGFGSVKSMEFSSERIAADSSFAQTDSVADSKSAEASDVHKEKASELRQDNGTVATVCIVFAVAALIYLCIKQFVKK